MLLGIAMVMVLFENQAQRRAGKYPCLSTLGVDPRRLLSASDLVPSMQGALARLMKRPAGTSRRHLYRATVARTLAVRYSRVFLRNSWKRWNKRSRRLHLRTRLPAERDFYVHDLSEMREPLPVGSVGAFAEFKRVLTEAEIRNLTAVSLQTRDTTSHNPVPARRAQGIWFLPGRA